MLSHFLCSLFLFLTVTRIRALPTVVRSAILDESRSPDFQTYGVDEEIFILVNFR
jgi:hypothetical protein